MKIAIVGASGHIGRALVKEAVSRFHDVTGIARDDAKIDALLRVTVRSADVLDAAAIQAALSGHDAVMASLKGREPRGEDTVPDAARMLLDVLPRAGSRRLLFIGGGGSLEARPGERFVDSPHFPEEYKAEALAQAEALAIFRASASPVAWSYASPPPMHLVDGEKTGVYRMQPGDRPIADANGQSRISVADFASAIIDVLERDLFIRERFTAGY